MWRTRSSRASWWASSRRWRPLRRRAEPPLKGVRAMLSRPAVVSGDLKGFPLPALLVSLHRMRRDGVLVVAYRDLTRRVFFARGGAVNYDSSARQDALPSYLLQRQVLTEAQAERWCRRWARGCASARRWRRRAWRRRARSCCSCCATTRRDRLAQVIGMREGRYAFYPGDEFQAEVATVETPALAPDAGRREARLPAQGAGRSAARAPGRVPGAHARVRQGPGRAGAEHGRPEARHADQRAHRAAGLAGARAGRSAARRTRCCGSSS